MIYRGKDKLAEALKRGLPKLAEKTPEQPILVEKIVVDVDAALSKDKAITESISKSMIVAKPKWATKEKSPAKIEEAKAPVKVKSKEFTTEELNLIKGIAGKDATKGYTPNISESVGSALKRQKRFNPKTGVEEATKDFFPDSLLTELSKDTLDSYHQKAKVSALHSQFLTDYYDDKSKDNRLTPETRKRFDKEADKSLKKLLKRTIYGDKAEAKLRHGPVAPYKKLTRKNSIKEDRLDELSKSVLGKYIRASSDALSDHSRSAGVNTLLANKNGGYYPKHQKLADEDHKLANRRLKGIERATDKLVKEDRLDEISQKVVGNYIRKATADYVNTQSERKKNLDNYIKSGGDAEAVKEKDKALTKRLFKRDRGMDSAVYRMIKE